MDDHKVVDMGNLLGVDIASIKTTLGNVIISLTKTVIVTLLSLGHFALHH